MADLQQLKAENEALQMENQYLRESKMALIQATAMEMERLRQFVSLLANALRGQGFTPQSIKQIERSVRSKNPALTKKKEATEWKWKQKLEQQQKQTNNKTSSSSTSSSRPPSNTNTNKITTSHLLHY